MLSQLRHGLLPMTQKNDQPRDEADDPSSPLYDLSRMRFSSSPTTPGAQPHNAGITPGFRHLVHENEPVTQKQLRKTMRRFERSALAAIETLAQRLTAIEEELRRRRSAGGAA